MRILIKNYYKQFIYSIVLYYIAVMDQEEMLERQKRLWKIFGRETQAGKQLFQLYNLGEKPKIQYPKTRPKTQKQIDTEKQSQMKSKKCPQKTLIEYPQLPKSQMPVFHPVDMIPKRKNEVTIRKQIEEYYEKRRKTIPINRGVDRANLVRKLQEKFKMQRGALPKGAQLPGLTEIHFDEEKVKNQALLRAGKKGQSYTNPIKNEQTKEPRKDRNEELADLFDAVVKEIDQRQQYLETVEHLDQPDLKNKIKKQIIERVAQLQKITELKK